MKLTTTRQQMIEHDCMDKLHWSIQKVAASSERAMMEALSNASFQRRMVTPIAPSSMFPFTIKPPDAPVIHRPSTPILIQPHTEVPPTPHTVDTLRSSIRLKTQCMTSGDILDEDADRLRISIETSTRMLQSELSSLRAQVVQKQSEESKKQTVRHLLLSIVPSGDDVAHLKALEEQISQIHTDIQHLSTSIGDGID